MTAKTENIVTLSKKTHHKFLSVYIQYPEVLRVLENIQAERPLTSGLEHSMQNKDVLQITIDHLYLPVLESSGLILKDAAQKNGWKSVYSDVRFENAVYTAKEKARVVASVAHEIASSIKVGEDRDTVFSVNVSGTYSKENIQKFFKSVRQVALEVLNSPSETGKTGVEFRIVMLGHAGGEKS